MTGFLPPCILFDLDGTIVDSLPGIEFSVREAFTACKLPLPKQNFRELIGPPIRSILSHAGKIVEEPQLDALEGAFRVSYDSEGWQKTVCYPEVKQILRMLRYRGYRLFVVSNKPRHASLRILESEQILACFEAIITRDSSSPCYRSKEEMINALLTEKLCRKGCIMVGDTIEDASTAAKIGIPFIWMEHGYGKLSEVSNLPISQTLQSFSQFYELMNQEPVLD